MRYIVAAVQGFGAAFLTLLLVAVVIGACVIVRVWRRATSIDRRLDAAAAKHPAPAERTQPGLGPNPAPGMPNPPGGASAEPPTVLPGAGLTPDEYEAIYDWDQSFIRNFGSRP